MAWQKRSTGRVYDSVSGHAYMVGCESGKVISMGVLAMACAVCRRCKRRGIEPSHHSCTINYDGSSGGMESTLCVELLEKISSDYEGRVHVGELVTDDDSTIRSRCRNKKDGGTVRDDVRTPVFLADPSHRVKVMGKAIFKLVSKTKNKDEVKTIDALRLKKYFSLYIAQNKMKPFEEFVTNAKAPIEHLFQDHTFCDESWCYAKSISQKLHNTIQISVQK